MRDEVAFCVAPAPGQTDNVAHRIWRRPVLVRVAAYDTAASDGATDDGATLS